MILINMKIFIRVVKDRLLLIFLLKYFILINKYRGLSVQGPSKGENRGPNDVVSDILKKAAEGNKEAIEAASNLKGKESNAFKGLGNRLGSENDDEQVNEGTNVNEDDEAWEEMDDEEPVTRNLTFWKDGFSIEDGPLMRYDEVS